MLRLHRPRHGDKTLENGHGAVEEGRTKKAWRFFVEWLKVSWKDILLMAVLGAVSQAIYKAPVAAVRNFPVTVDSSGEVVYPQLAYPDRKWIISSQLSAVLSVLVPIAIIFLAQIRIRSFWDANNAVFGLLYAVILATLFQVILKQTIGGFRPYFLDVCKPDISLAASQNHTELNGVGFRRIMYTVDICTNPDKDALKLAMSSFPSGHSSTGFAGLGFLFLWMNAKMKVWANYRASFWQLSLLFAPILGTTLIACSLTIDQAHNWYDIVAGAAIGTMMAFASYRVCYAAIWDWRFNHLPLKKVSAFDYGAPGDMEYAVFTHNFSWGRKRRDPPGPDRAVGGSFRRSDAHGRDVAGDQMV